MPPLGCKPAIGKRGVASFPSVSLSSFLLSAIWSYKTSKLRMFNRGAKLAFSLCAPVGSSVVPYWDLTLPSPLTWMMHSLPGLLRQPSHSAPDPVGSFGPILMQLPHSAAPLGRAPSRSIQSQSSLSTCFLDCTTCACGSPLTHLIYARGFSLALCFGFIGIYLTILYSKIYQALQMCLSSPSHQLE